MGVDLEDWERYRLDRGDLLFARSGATVGKPYIHRPNDGTYLFAGYLIRFRLDDSKLRPEVAFGFTQTAAYDVWVAGKQRTAAQPNINGREYASLEFPVPPPDLQEHYGELVARKRTVNSQSQVAGRGAAALANSIMTKLLSSHEP